MNFIKSNDHILVEFEDGYYVVDTGSPFSFNFYGANWVVINGNEFCISSTIPPLVNQNAIEELVGVPVVGFIGMDILKHTNLTVDFENEEILFGVPEAEDKHGYCIVTLKEMLGEIVYTEDLMIGGKRVKAIIDTGAIYSYVAGSFANVFEITAETLVDYNPEVGEIKSDIYKGRLSIYNSPIGYEVDVKVGIMPPVFELLGMDAIVGINVLSEKCIFFDFSENILGIKPDERCKRALS